MLCNSNSNGKLRGCIPGWPDGFTSGSTSEGQAAMLQEVLVTLSLTTWGRMAAGQVDIGRVPFAG